jgi:arginyl-tRNA synthetase
MKDVIADIIKDSLNEEKIDFPEEKIKDLIEIPPSHEMGDFAFPCFPLSKIAKENPNKIAINLRKNMKLRAGISEIETSGPYVNFFIDRKSLALQLIDRIKKEKGSYGKPREISKTKSMVEFPSPNTNKPLHLGHLRNISIGESVSRILEFNGEKVIRANLNNDRGIHICKSMAAYKFYGKDKTPKSEDKKSDHFVGDYYVLFNTKSEKNKELEIASHRMLQLWEQGDKEVRALWKKMNKWALDGFKETYKIFGIKHKVEFFESDIYEEGKEIVMNGLKDKIFEKTKDGAVKINLKKEKLGEKILLRIDGTSVYITQDLYLAKLKFEKYKIDKSIYVVGNEQNYHFNVLFTILKKLGFENRDMKHLSYGMVNLPEGKMKSREGTVVDADDLIEKVQDLVKKELTKREDKKLSKKLIDKRSLIIALASIKYLLLKVDIKKNMTFNPKESINFEGDTGPYILYSYARANSIIKKLKDSKKSKAYFEGLHDKEIALVKKLEEFKQIVKNSYKTLNPSLIANYSYQLAQTFNEFYHACPVKNSEKEFFRLGLVKSFKQVLENSLNLLGIETLEKM